MITFQLKSLTLKDIATLILGGKGVLLAKIKNIQYILVLIVGKANNETNGPKPIVFHQTVLLVDLE